jgi:hypothetical protein
VNHVANPVPRGGARLLGREARQIETLFLEGRTADLRFMAHSCSAADPSTSVACGCCAAATAPDAAPPTAAAPLKDRRRSEPRVVCERPISILACAGADAARFGPAQMTDCSPHGLGLMLAHRVEPGQQVLVKMELAGQLVMLMYTVRYCIPMQPDKFRTGARFTGMQASRFRGEPSAIVATLTGR